SRLIEMQMHIYGHALALAATLEEEEADFLPIFSATGLVATLAALRSSASAATHQKGFSNTGTVYHFYRFMYFSSNTET
ncbi:hypothetical protein ACJX0J_033205, partial [Zea mays]